MQRNASGTYIQSVAGGETVWAFVPIPLPSQLPLYRRLYFKQHRAVFYGLLNGVHTARRLVTLFQQDAQRVQSSGRGAANVLRVLDAMRRRPLCSVKQLCVDAGMTFPTAAKALQTLATLGITRELTGQRRNRVFVYDGYLNILNEGGEPL